MPRFTERSAGTPLTLAAELSEKIKIMRKIMNKKAALEAVTYFHGSGGMPGVTASGHFHFGFPSKVDSFSFAFAKSAGLVGSGSGRPVGAGGAGSAARDNASNRA